MILTFMSSALIISVNCGVIDRWYMWLKEIKVEASSLDIHLLPGLSLGLEPEQ